MVERFLVQSTGYNRKPHIRSRRLFIGSSISDSSSVVSAERTGERGDLGYFHIFELLKLALENSHRIALHVEARASFYRLVWVLQMECSNRTR